MKTDKSIWICHNFIGRVQKNSTFIALTSRTKGTYKNEKFKMKYSYSENIIKPRK